MRYEELTGPQGVGQCGQDDHRQEDYGGRRQHGEPDAGLHHQDDRLRGVRQPCGRIREARETLLTARQIQAQHLYAEGTMNAATVPVLMLNRGCGRPEDAAVVLAQLL